MSKIRMAKFAGVAVAATLAFGAFVPMAGAVTVAELQAQINALMAQLAALQGGSAATTASCTFTRSLTVGASGADVTCLQNYLIGAGYSVPAGATGFFGSQTKAAVSAWQAANGVSPAVGYFGPVSQAKFSAMGGATGTVTGTTVGGGTTVSGSISTPGAEGDITVTAAPVSNSTIYAGDKKDTVLAFKVKASNSDVLVQRVKVVFPNANAINKVFNKIYVMSDDGSVLASSDLNTTTATKESDDTYSITLGGFSSLVKKDDTRTYSVAVDLMPSIDSTYRTSYSLNLAADGVRAVDGAGINLYSPTAATDITKSVTVAASLTDSASLTVSTNSSNPRSNEVVASNGSNNDEADKVVLLTFDIAADKDNITITDLKNFVVTRSGGAATASTTYLYEGNGTGGTLLGSASLSGSDADFTDISSTIAKGATKTYTLAADVRTAGATQTTISASFTGNTTDVVAESSDGTTVGTVTGSATGNSIYVRNIGPEFSLVGTPTATRVAGGAFSGATSSVEVHYTLRMTAVGTDVEFGDTGSTTYALADQDNTLAAGESIVPYLSGTATHPVVSSSTALTIDTSKVTTAGTNSYKLAENNSIDIPIVFTMQTKTSAGADISFGAYSFGLERLNWLTSATGRQASTFMSGDTAWRSNTVTLP